MFAGTEKREGSEAQDLGRTGAQDYLLGLDVVEGRDPLYQSIVIYEGITICPGSEFKALVSARSVGDPPSNLATVR